MAKRKTNKDELPIRKVKPNSDPESQKLGLDISDEERVNWNNGEDRRTSDSTLDEWSQIARPVGLLGYALKNNRVTPPSNERPLNSATLSEQARELENQVEANPVEAKEEFKNTPLEVEADQIINDNDKRNDEVNNEAALATVDELYNIDEQAAEWREEQKNKQHPEEDISIDEAKANYEQLSDAAADILNFNEDIPESKEEKEARKEYERAEKARYDAEIKAGKEEYEYERKEAEKAWNDFKKNYNASQKEQFIQACNETHVNIRNSFNKFFNEFEDEKWKERFQQLNDEMDEDLNKFDESIRKENFEENPFKDTLTDVGMVEGEIEDDIELPEYEKDKARELFYDLKLSLGKGAPQFGMPGLIPLGIEQETMSGGSGIMGGGSYGMLGSGSLIRSGVIDKGTIDTYKEDDSRAYSKVDDDISGYKETEKVAAPNSSRNVVKQPSAGISPMVAGRSARKSSRFNVSKSHLPSGGGHTSKGGAGGTIRKPSTNVTNISIKQRILLAAARWPGHKKTIEGFHIKVVGERVYIETYNLDNFIKRYPDIIRRIVAQL